MKKYEPTNETKVYAGITLDRNTIANLNRKPTDVGSFNNMPIRFELFSDDVITEIKSSVNYLGYRLIDDSCKSPFIAPSYFEIQHHDCSVAEHTDVVKENFFCIIPYELTTLSEAMYAHNPLFTFYGGDNRKRVVELIKDEPVVFNPRKPHSLTYYGVSVKLIMFVVEKLK